MISSRKKLRPKIVVIGGGTGLPVVLKGLRKKNADITAVVTVADDGGSSGIIRDYINVVPPGDIRNVLAALSDMPKLYKDIFQYRFSSNDQFFSGHAIGNLIIAALTEMDNVWVTSADGSKPEAKQEVVDAILDADQIVLGPGSLFTSILPNLMIENVGEAVCRSEAEVVYICNIMTQKGETEHFTDADHVRVLNRHLKQNFIDTVLVNTEPVPKNYLDRQKYDEYLYQVKYDFKGLRDQGCRVISDNFLKLRNQGVFHNGDQVVDELMCLAGRPKSWRADESN